jgi:hypothetical protein
MKPARLLPFIALLAALLPSCKKEESGPVDLGYGYFPRTVGSWIDYQVDSTFRDDAGGVLVQVSYELREKVVEAYTDPTGAVSWRIHRMVRDDDGQWVVRDVWTSTKDDRVAEVTEENERRQKLTFPVRDGRSWDINALNAAPELMVAYRQAETTWAINGMSFARTVLVKNTVPPNPVVKRNFEERWAHGIGMVSKYWEETNTQTTGVTGFRLDMTVIGYGQD